MNPILAVYRKELTDLLRDRRTIISMIVVPMLIIPAIMTIFGTVSAKLVQNALAQVPKVMLLGGDESPLVRAALAAEKRFELVPAAADYAARITEKTLRAAVEVPRDFDARLAAGQAAVPVKIFHYQGEIRSGFAADQLEKFFRDLRDRTLVARIEARGLPPDFAKPITATRQNVAPPEKVAGSVVGIILPYLIILLCFTGAMYPALDLTAGEKERGTMETILSSPVHRSQLVAGKFLVVLTISLCTALFAVTAMAGFYLLSRGMFGVALTGKLNLGELTIAPEALVAVFALLVPLAVLFSAVLLGVGSFARSYKEAQSYAAPMVAVVILPAAATMLPGVELTWKFAFVPILNVSLATKEVFGGTYPWAMLAVIFASSCLYAGVAFAVITRLFQREEIVFRT